MGSFKNLVGFKFGRLEVICRYNKSGEGKVKWLCKCECGGQTIAQSAHLLDGRRVSCGCAKKPGNQVNHMKPKSHGHCVNGKSSKIYRIWSGMLTRCENKNAQSYKYYGARGIRVCDRWKYFVNFISDMGIPPEGTSLDRINVNGDYDPENCRWATSNEQGRNKRSNTLLTFKNKTMTLIEWAEEYQIDKSTLWSRLMKCEWSIEKALSEKLWTKSEAAKYGNKVRWERGGIYQLKR